jgi:hypothetical protein
MEPVYSIFGNAMLSPAAAALDEPTLDAYTVLAETALGLRGTNFTGAYAETATLANVLQVNYQLSLPNEVWYVSQEERGQRKVIYRGIADLLVDRRAASLVAPLLVSDPSAGWVLFGPRR